MVHKIPKLILISLVLVIFSLGFIAYGTLHLTKDGIVYNMGKPCESAVDLAYRDKTLMNSTLQKLSRFFDIYAKYGYTCEYSINKYSTPNIFRDLDLDWEKLHPDPYNPDVIYIFKDDCMKIIKEQKITPDMVDKVEVCDSSCCYVFDLHNNTSGNIDMNSTKLSVRVGYRTEIEANITSSGIEREYFWRF